MSCAEIIPKLELMADDELSSEQAAEVLSHIDDCASCRDNWYGILNLRQAIKDRAASFKPSEGFEAKLITAVRKEAWQARGASKPSDFYLYAAALILAGIAAAFIFRMSGPPVTIASGPVDASGSVVASGPGVASGSVVASGLGVASGPALAVTSVAPSSLDDALANFKQFLKLPGADQIAKTNDGDLNSLSDRVGFPIKTMQLNGFKLAGAQILSAAPGKAPMVRLCYMRAKGKGHDSIVCYQAAAGNLIAKGLNEHMIDGKKICCGEVEDKSIVYIPGQKSNANEVLLLGTISKSDLMDLVLSSS